MPGGQPPKYKTVKELQDKIDLYFEEMESPESDKRPTVTGLAYYLGFESRQSIYDYKKSEKYSYTIKRAILYIEVKYEEMLTSKHITGAIFALKNFGWKDQNFTDITTNGDSIKLPAEWD